MSQPGHDARWPLLCFCSTWNNGTDGTVMTDEEYKERGDMMIEISRGAAPPANIARWHGISVCPGPGGGKKKP